MRAASLRLLLLAAVAANLACRRGAQTLAVVGDERITLDELAAAVQAQAGRPLAEASPELTAALFENLVEEEVVLAASPADADRGLTGTPRTARVRELLASLCPQPSTPPDSDVAAYLERHPELRRSGERLFIRQLVLPDSATARVAQERVRRGEDFAAVSRELSRAPNAATGGTIGWVERGQLPPEFEAAVFGLPEGEVAAPVLSSAGWHVFQVVERVRAGGGVDEDTLRSIRAELAAQAAEAARRSCLRTLAARVGVAVRCEGAPFPCRNPFEETP